MRIWSLCTKMFQKHKKMRESLFAKSDGFQCEYSYSEVYLGAKSKVTLAEEGIEVSMSYSVRDGILVKIKRNKPYSVLFDYIDGAYLINDEKDRGYVWLVESLNALKNGSDKCHSLKTHDNVEKIVYRFLVESFKQ